MPTKVKPARGGRKEESLLAMEFEKSRALRIVAVIAILGFTTWILAALFSHGPRYSLVASTHGPVESEAFLKQIEPLVNSKVTTNNQIEVFPNGENFYEAELASLRQAQRSINIEAYIFHRGQVTRRLLEVLAERARAGVKVRLVVDALGSFSTSKRYFKSLTEAGGRIEWYHPLRWNNWFRSNNRTHREMIVVDGSTAFVGGAGFADWWRFPKGGHPRWRDTMFRVQGNAALHVQGTFVENWLEASGEILNGDDYFPLLSRDPGRTPAMVVVSTPSAGGSTRSRILFETLIGAARKSIYINTPYFLPDQGMQQELVRAVKLGVTVKIIVPGKHGDHSLTRSSGRAAYGDLLKAGAGIYEYDASMIHCKIMIIDGVWSVVGSTNLDNRSFGINDEVNLAALDSAVATRLTQDFEQDLSHSEHQTLEAWNKRSLYERALESIGWVLENQQ
ncbi:MAG: cardiolipin synthase B [Acidobacteria bacterium]|nr:MAG: cardiolipin synthase B [Acidobacteriota bacterium]